MPQDKNDKRCSQLFERLATALDLKFVPAEDVTEDGWYIWRANANWPISAYDIYELTNGEMQEPVKMPARSSNDNYSAVWVITGVKPYGELAGPILG